MVLVLAIVGIAAIHDLRTGKIPNALTVPALLLGLALGLEPGAAVPLEDRALGLGLAFLPSYLLFLGRSLGGGDVKLLAAVGAGLGYPLVLDALVASIVVGVAMGVFALVRSGRLLHTLEGFAVLGVALRTGAVRPVIPAGDLDLPFGVAVFGGVAWTVAPTLLASLGLADLAR